MKVKLKDASNKQIMVSPLEVGFLTRHGWKQVKETKKAAKTTEPVEGAK